MATSTVDVVVRTTGQQALAKLQESLNQVAKAAASSQSAVDKFAQEYAKTESTIKRTAATLEKTKASIDKVSASLKQQNTTNAETASNLLRVKRAYEELQAAATASAAAGGKGFDKETVSRLRGLTTEIERYREQLATGKQASAAFGQELERLGVKKERLTKLTQAQEAAQKSWKGQLNLLGVQVKQLGNDLQAAGVGFGGLTSRLASFAAQLGITIGAITLLKSSLDAAFERGNAEQRLRNLTDSTAEYEFATKAAAVAANQFGLTQTQALGAIGDLYGRLKGVGYGLKEVNEIYTGFNTVARQGGVAAEEAAGAFFQFSQALGKGKLNGDEFVILGERMPQLLDHIAAAAGIGRDQLSQFAQDGKLTGDVLYRAMVLAGQGAEGLSGTLTEQQVTMATVRQRAEEMKVQLGEAFAPAFLTVMEGMANAALLIANGFEKVNVWVQQNKQGMIDFVNAALKFGQIVGAVFIVVKAYQALQKAIAAAAAAKAFLVGLTGKGLFLVGAAAAAAGAAYLALGAVVDGVGNEIESLAKESADEMAKMKAEVDAAAGGMSKLPKPAEDTAKAAKELKEAQAAVTKEIQDTTKAIEQQAQAQTTAVDQALSVTQARLQAEQAINQVLLDQAQRQLQAATSQEDRVIAARAIYELTVRQAQLELQATKATIAAELEKAKIAKSSAELKAKEVEAVVQLAIAQKTVTAAHFEALRTQQQAVQLADKQLRTAQTVAEYQNQAAEATYRGKVEAAGAAYQTNILAKNTEAAADAAGRYANEMQKASKAAQAAADAQRAAAGYGISNGVIDAFGEAGKNSQFINSWREAIAGITDGRGLFQERDYWRIFNDFLQRAEGYNKGKARERNAAASEDWRKYTGEGPTYGDSVRNAIVNIQTGPVTQMGGEQYVTKGDMERATRETANQVLSQLRNNPATRREVGLAQ